MITIKTVNHDENQTVISIKKGHRTKKWSLVQQQ